MISNFISHQECSKYSFKDIINKKQYLSNYQNYMNFANKIFSYDFHHSKGQNRLYMLNATNKIIRILSLDIQNSIISRTLKSESRGPDMIPLFASPPHTCFRCSNNIDKTKAMPLSTHLMFNISQHPTISYPWNQHRLLRSIGKIGTTSQNPFSFKNDNHFNSLLISPINLLIIGNGYHSSTSGIYDTNAIFYPENIVDISCLYKYIYFDGIAFRHTQCNSILESPVDKSIGIIYEIGRLLIQNNLNLLSLLTSDLTIPQYNNQFIYENHYHNNFL